MTDPIIFEVIGIPAPQGSKSAFVVKGRAVIVEAGSKTGREKQKLWRQDVQMAALNVAQDLPEAPLDEPLLLRIAFRLPLPKSDPHRTRHTTSADLDKLVRNVGDALTNSGLIRDDSIIYAIQATKTYARSTPSGATIELHRHGAREQSDRQQSIEDAARARKEAKQVKQA